MIKKDILFDIGLLKNKKDESAIITGIQIAVSKDLAEGSICYEVRVGKEYGSRIFSQKELIEWRDAA